MDLNCGRTKEVTFNEHPALPPGWAWARVGDVGRVQLGRARSPEHHTGEHMRPYLRAANVFENFIDTSHVLRMNFTPEEYEIYALKPGDILLNEGQSRELVGRPAMFRGEVPGACFQNTLVRFQAGPAVIPEYAFQLFRYHLRSGRFQKIAQQTTNLAHLGATRFANMEFPVPPLAEQRLLAEKLAELLDRSRRIEAALDAIAAEEAKAVALWTGDAWPTRRLGDLISRRNEKVGDRWPSATVVGLSNEGEITKRRGALGAKTAFRCGVVYPGDVVFNPIRFSIGSIARYRGAGPAIVSPEYVVFTTSADLSAELLVRFLRSARGRSYLETATTGSVRYRVYFKNIAKFVIPVPPPSEQRRAEAFFRTIGSIVRASGGIRTRLNELEYALLSKVFRGELVPQDPDDEPASVLLERVRRLEGDVAAPPKVSRSKKPPSSVAPAIPRDLVETVRAHGGTLTPEELYRQSGHADVDVFYAALRDAIRTQRALQERRGANGAARIVVTR